MNSEQRQYIDKILQKQEEFRHKAREMYGAGSTRHSHAEIGDYFKCFHCMIQKRNQMEVRHKFGLSSGRKYLRWRKENSINLPTKLQRARDNIYKF